MILEPGYMSFISNELLIWAKSLSYAGRVSRKSFSKMRCITIQGGRNINGT